MSALPFSTLYDMIAPWAKKVNTIAMDNAIREAARDFCFRSKFRRVSTDPITVNIGQPDYALTGGNTDEEVILIQAAQYADSSGQVYTLKPIQPEQGDNSTPPSTNGQQICGFWLTPPSVISLYPVPQASVPNSLVVRCILQPTKTATTLDSSIIQMYDNTIAWGALSRLLRRNGEPYTDMNKAMEFQRDFERGVGDATTQAAFGFQQWNQTSAVYRY